MQIFSPVDPVDIQFQIMHSLGQYFLVPYIQASYAEVYALMREEAHANGISDFSELPGFFPAR